MHTAGVVDASWRCRADHLPGSSGRRGAALPNLAVLDQGDGAARRRGRPLRHALRACGVGAGPSGRADRAARRTAGISVRLPQRRRPAQHSPHGQGARSPAGSPGVLFSGPDGMQSRPRQRGELFLHASGGGLGLGDGSQCAWV